MLDAWAAAEAETLCQGTANGCADQPVVFPSAYISLDWVAHLVTLPQRRAQPGYSPRLYPGFVNGEVAVWVFRWSASDVALGFVGESDRCGAARFLELVAAVSFREELGLTDGSTFEFAFK